MTKNWQQWKEQKLQEALPVGGYSPDKQIGGDPTVSVLTKLQKGLQGGVMPDGYVDLGVLSREFGLDQDEINILQQLKVVVQTPSHQGVNWSIDQNRFNSVFTQMSQGRSAMGYQQQQKPRPQPRLSPTGVPISGKAPGLPPQRRAV